MVSSLRHASTRDQRCIVSKYLCFLLFLVTIVLTPDIDDDSPSRNFTLDANSNVMPIGRASKRDQKGRTPAGDNGWFDSRVMSRDHAEIIFQDTSKVGAALFFL